MPRKPSEAGFTLIEVLIALVMLAILSMALMSNSAKMIRSVTDDRARTIATASADERIARARVWPNYATLDNLAVTESGVPQAGWSRATTVTRTGGSGLANDFKRVTVVVTGPGLPVPISRTITVAAP